MALKVGELFATLELDDKQFNQSMGNAESKFGKMSANITSMAAGLATAIGAGIVAGVGAVAVGADKLSGALNHLEASTGATAEEMEGFEQSLLNIYNNNYGENFEDIANSMSEVKRATGLAGNELEKMTQDALMLRDTFEYEVAESTKTADTMMKQFGISGEQAMTLIAQGAQQGLDKHGDMLDTFNEYSVYFKQMGFDAEGMFNILAEGAESGAFNLDKVGDAIKEMGIRVKDGSKASAESFAGLGMNADDMAQRFAAGGESAQQAFMEVMQGLAKIEDPVQRNAIGVGLMGTQFEDLEHKAILALGNVQEHANMNADTLQKINDIKYDTFGDAMQGIGRQIFTNLVIPISEKLLPVLNQFANWLQEKMPQIKQTVDVAFTAIGNAVNKVKEFFARFTSDTDKNGNSIMSKFSAIKENISAAMKNVWEIIKSISQIITALWNEFGDDVLATWLTVWKTVSSVLKSITAVLRGVLDVFIGLFTGDFSRMGKGLVSIWKGVWNAIKSVVGGAWSLLKIAFVSLATAIANWFKTLATNAFSWGKDIISGMINGLKSKVKALENQAKEIASNVGGTIKKFFGIASPSKLMKQYGEWISEGLAEGIRAKEKDPEDAMKKIAEKAKEIAQQAYENSANWIDRRKKMVGMSLVEELKAWVRVKEKYKQGTEEYENAEMKVLETKQEIYRKTQEIANDYAENVKRINDEIAQKETELTQKYTDALKSRQSAIVSFVGLFDEVKEKTDVTSQGMLKNLTDQVQHLRKWSSDLKTLAERGISKGLLEELQKMGANAQPYIETLSTMTDSELNEFVGLWQEKNRIAREQAVKELEPLKTEVENEIATMRAKAETKMDELHETMTTKMQEIRTGSTKEFALINPSMKEIGNEMINSLMKGISAMEPKLKSKLQGVADSVKSTLDGVIGSGTASRFKVSAPTLKSLNATIKPSLASDGMRAPTGVVVNLNGDNHFNNDMDVDTFTTRIGNDIKHQMRLGGVKG